MDRSEVTIEIVRVINATAEELYAAWTDPETLARWLTEGHDGVRAAETDPREGGRYRVEVREPDGRKRSIAGEYREVDPPRRLVMTWVEEDHGADAEHAGETLLAVSFREVKPAVTELTLKHTLMPRAEDGRSHHEAWALRLDKLAALDVHIHPAKALAFAAW